MSEALNRTAVTSAIDSFLHTAFRSGWRDIQPIFEEKFKPADPRNRRLLHATFLFGSVNQVDENSRPPLSRIEWIKRKPVAVSLARRLPDLVTPLGTLVIVGWAGSHDWLQPDDLLPVLDSFARGQVHLFNTRETALSDPSVHYLLNNQKVIMHPDSLAEVLLQGQERGLISLGATAEQDRAGRRIRIGKTSAVVPRDVWIHISRSAVLVDEMALIPPKSVSEDAKYYEFRSFLSSAEGKPQWSAFARDFAFVREYEHLLRRAALDQLGKHSLSEDPLILHGATGTGKTMALAHLAFDIAQQGQYPVLFIERRTQQPIYSDIDSFCEWAENHGAPSSLIVWDGMLDVESYSEFIRKLTNRGRKLVLIGSSYKLPDDRAKKLGGIEAPSALSDREKNDLLSFLKRFHPSLDQVVKSSLDKIDQTFLVALYRLLPPTRMALRVGVSGEVAHAEQQIMKKAFALTEEVQPNTLLAQQLRKAGIIGDEPLFTGLKKTVGDEVVSDIQDLTDLVMVPGRFGLRVPIELLLRTLGKRETLRVIKLFEDVDIFHWYEDSSGNIEVGARNALEAELIVSSRLGNPQTVIAFAKRLLLDIRDEGNEFRTDNEVTFAVDLLHAIGPQGQHEGEFSQYFRDLASALKDLRDNRGVKNPRLMLQEANLLREWARRRDKVEPSDPQIDGALAQVEQVVREALELVGETRRSRSLSNFLFNELTAALASRALRHKADHFELQTYFHEAKLACSQARHQDPNSYYPIHILAWFSRDMLKSGVLDDATSAEVVADVLSAFQTAETIELDLEQEIMLQTRRMEFGANLNLTELEEQAFLNLEAKGSAAGYYLRARRLSGLPETADPINSKSLEKLEGALKYLESNWHRISSDARCLELCFDLWWLVHTGVRLFTHERSIVSLSREQWTACLHLIESIEATGESQRPLVLAYVRGLALFHLERIEEAFQTFRELERESERTMGRRRIIRSYLASTSQGLPKKYHGIVSWVATDGNKGTVRVEALRRLVDFRPRDFRQPDIVPRSSLGEFHIAFNFLGPIADPVSFFKK